MANTFDRKLSTLVGTSPATVGGYTVGASTTTVVVGLTISNILGSSIAVDVAVNDGSDNYYLVKGAPISAGGALVPIGGDQKLVLNTNDSLVVTSDAANSASVVMSIMEIT